MPPANDNLADAVVISPGSGGGGGGAEHTLSGSTVGSTIETNEPHPIIGGQAPADSGSVWWKYTAPAPGFLTVWAESALDAEHWPIVTLYEGATSPVIIVRPRRISPYQNNSNGPYGAAPSHFEVREDKTYFIRAFRDADQLEGAFNLGLTENLETIDWEQAVDGFTSTTGAPSVSAGELFCNGVVQYGTFDAGAAPPKWNREFNVHLEVKNQTGRTLIRHGSDGSPFTTAAVVNKRLGLFRIRDVDGTAVWHLYLYPNINGENYLTFGDDTRTIPVSLGERSNDDEGWIAIDMTFVANNAQNWDSTANVDWYLDVVHVDGRPYRLNTSLVPATQGAAFSGKRPRYFDFGYWRYTTMSAGDLSNLEDPDGWSTYFRRMCVTNIVPREPYDFEVVPNIRKITQFDGFPQGVSWHRLLHNWGSLGTLSTEGTFNVGTTGAVDTATGAYLPLTAAPGGKSGYAARSLWPGGFPFDVQYDGQWGSRRWHGFWFYATAFPETGDNVTSIAGYSISLLGGAALSTLRLDDAGELRIVPYYQPDFCVARLEEGNWYWIEVHTDAEVMWDVKSQVYINGQYFGEYTNKMTWADLLAFGGSPQERDVYGDIYQTSAYRLQTNLQFGTPGSFGFWFDQDVWFTGFVTGRGVPGESAGPLESVAHRAMEELDQDPVGTHYMPATPAESVYLRGTRNGSGGTMEEKAWRVFGWSVADGPSSFSQGWPPPAPFVAPTSNTTRFYVRSPDPVTGGILGDSVLAVVEASGAGTLIGAVQEWDPGGAGGSLEPTNTHLTEALSGTAKQYWSTALPFWVSTLGTGVIPQISWTGGSGTLTMTNFRLLQNPLIFPRFAYTDNDGATWTWIEASDTASASRILDNVSVAGTGKALYTDTIGALERMQVNNGNIAGHGAPMHRASNGKFWYVEYNGDTPTATDVYAVNLWSRFKGHWGPPRSDLTLHDGTLRTHLAIGENDGRRVGDFTSRRYGSSVPVGASTVDKAVIDRATLARAPDGNPWSVDRVGVTKLRIGMHSALLTGDTHDYELHTDAQAVQSDQRSGAKVYALSMELLVPADPYAPPPGCFTLLSMNWRSSDRQGNTWRVLVGDR